MVVRRTTRTGVLELETNTKGRGRFILDQEGQYRIVIKGRNARGKYAVSWTRE